MSTYTIELPDSIFIRTVDGEAFNVKPADIEAVLGRVTITGMKVLMTNVYNGGGAAATDSERKAALLKKYDSWKRGEFNVVERGESQFTAFREVFIGDCVAVGLTTKQAEAIIKAKVADKLGKDAKATFANFIEATAIETAADSKGTVTRDDARAALEGYYTSESDKRAKANAATQAKLVAPTLDLSAFLKVAK